jgi:uncharacterized protein YeaO (DUF488 family)
MADMLLKRIYEPALETDGTRILVDRVWPRGISKENAQLAGWYKEIAPSSELRKWFCHKPELFAEFRQRYLAELQNDERKFGLVMKLTEMAREGKLTILYGAKDPVHNQAVVLCEEINRRLAEK